MAHPKSYSVEIVNALLRKQVRGYDNSGGNLLLIGVAWNINRGKEYRKIQRNINNEERENGYLEIVGFAFYMKLHWQQPDLFLPFIDDINSGSSQCACYQILPVEGFAKTEAGGDGSY